MLSSSIMALRRLSQQTDSPTLMQAIVLKLDNLRRQNVTFRNYPSRLIDESSWRAGRYGLDGKLIDIGRKREMEARELLHEMLEFVAAEVEELGNEREMARLERIMREGTGADRQLSPCGSAPGTLRRWSIISWTKPAKGCE